MKNSFYTKITNNALLISGLLSVSSGLIIQIKFHMGNNGVIDTRRTVFGILYYDWSVVHKIAIVAMSLFVIFHVFVHWRWYRVVLKKRLLEKNFQVLTLSILFALTAIMGFVPWIVDLQDGNKILRKDMIEVHDKLGIFLSLFLISHVAERIRWYSTFIDNLRDNRNAS